MKNIDLSKFSDESIDFLYSQCENFVEKQHVSMESPLRQLCKDFGMMEGKPQFILLSMFIYRELLLRRAG